MAPRQDSSLKKLTIIKKSPVNTKSMDSPSDEVMWSGPLTVKPRGDLGTHTHTTSRSHGRNSLLQMDSKGSLDS
jgi:hypothetical protein